MVDKLIDILEGSINNIRISQEKKGFILTSTHGLANITLGDSGKPVVFKLIDGLNDDNFQDEINNIVDMHLDLSVNLDNINIAEIVITLNRGSIILMFEWCGTSEPEVFIENLSRNHKKTCLEKLADGLGSMVSFDVSTIIFGSLGFVVVVLADLAVYFTSCLICTVVWNYIVSKITNLPQCNFMTMLAVMLILTLLPIRSTKTKE